MKFSVVTISYNQNEFLDRTIRSVLDQSGLDVEYILVDPGSTDGSRETIARYQSHLAKVILENDAGPSDGLNKGFAYATGDIYCYINSDDTFEAHAFSRVADYFDAHPDVDVVCGHSWVIDRNDTRLRKAWSEPFRRCMVAYGASVQIQPSTFIRRESFLRSGGFNIDNSSTWDGELLVDLFLTGARIRTMDAVLSNYRLHGASITNSGRLAQRQREMAEIRFRRLMGRPWRRWDRSIQNGLLLWKHLSQPLVTFERVTKGPIFNRHVS